MTGVRFVTVTELKQGATAIVAEVELTGGQVAIIRHGKPFALLRPVKGKEKGQEVTVSSLDNDTENVLKGIEALGSKAIITRYGDPVAVIQRITDDVFRIDK